MSWTLSKNGFFTIKSPRDTRWLNEPTPDHIWTDIWNIQLPSKIAFFVWIMIKRYPPTIDLLQKRGLMIPNTCSLCMKEVKSIDHIFIHCPYITKVWVRLVREIGLSWVAPNRVKLMLASWNIRNIPKKYATL